MTEDQIERHVEWRTDRLDERYMSGELTTAEYNAAIRNLAAWADEQYEIFCQQFYFGE